MLNFTLTWLHCLNLIRSILTLCFVNEVHGTVVKTISLGLSGTVDLKCCDIGDSPVTLTDPPPTHIHTPGIRKRKIVCGNGVSYY